MTIQTATPRRQTRLVYRILHDMLLCTKCCMDIGRVAQLVEQVTFNHWVTGSNPVALTTSRPLSPFNGTVAFLLRFAFQLSLLA